MYCDENQNIVHVNMVLPGKIVKFATREECGINLMGWVIRKSENTDKCVPPRKKSYRNRLFFILVVTLFEQTSLTIILFAGVTHTAGKKPETGFASVWTFASLQNFHG